MAASGVQWRKHLKVIWCMMEVFCIGGLQIGWASLVFVFKREGYFSDGCKTGNLTTGSESSPVECDDQDGQLSLLYSLANGISIIPIFLCGTCISQFGPMKTRIAYTCIFALGCVMMILSNSDMPWFACAGLTLLAGGGRVFIITNLQISRLYKTGSFIVIALVSGCFDSSSAMTLFVKLAYEAGFGVRLSFIVILALSMTAFVNTYVNFREPFLTEQKQSGNEGASGNENEDGSHRWTLCTLYKTYVCRGLAISHFSWFTLMVIHFFFFIASSNIYIRDVSDGTDNTESSLTNVLSIALLNGIVAALVTGIILERVQYKMKGSVYIRDLKTSTVGLVTTIALSSSLAVLSIFHVVYVVYATFIVLTIFRSFLFATTVSFIAKAFPEKAFGALIAIIDIITCLVLFVQRAFFQWLQAYDNADLHIRISLLVISVLALHHPLMLLVKIRRDKKDGCIDEETTPDDPAPLVLPC